MENEKKKCINIFFQNFPVAGTKEKKIWSRNLKWATAHFSIGWAGRRARGKARAQGAQGRWVWRPAVGAHGRGEHWRGARGRGARGVRKAHGSDMRGARGRRAA